MKLIYILIFLGILIASYFLIRAIIIIVKGLIRIINNYRKLGRKEFLSRLKDGAERISPTQRTKSEIVGMIITLIGILTGLIATPIMRIEGVWFWVEIILVGSLIISIIQLFSKWQIYGVLKKQDEILKQLNIQNG